MEKDCTSCGASIHLLKDKRTGRWMPVNDEISDKGNIRVDLDAGTAEVLTTEQLVAARFSGEALSLSHFATCPQAHRHRRRKVDR